MSETLFCMKRQLQNLHMIWSESVRQVFIALPGVLMVVLMISLTGCGLLNKSPNVPREKSSSSVADSEPAKIDPTAADRTVPASSASDIESASAAATTGTEATFVDDNSWVYVNTAWLNIRQGPSTESEILTQVYYGQALQRTAAGRDWSAVLLEGGLAGYAFNSYLSLDPLPSPTPAWPVPTPVLSEPTPTTTGR